MIIESSNHYQRRSKEKSSIASRWLAPPAVVYCATPAVVHRAAPAALKRAVQYCEPLARTPQLSRNLSQAREKTRQRRTPKRLTALSCPHWRSDRDSNSGTACDGYTLSRRASSATRAPLLIFTQNNLSSKKRCKDNAFFLI